MKKIWLGALVLTLIYSFGAQAERLLSCNPPMGSSLQEVEIYKENSQIYLRELKMSGAYAQPIVVSPEAWAQKNLKWTSKEDGKVNLYLSKSDGWFYVATQLGSKVIGNCDSN